MGLAFPKGDPGVVRKHRKRVEADAALRECYADVDARDGGFSWITGRYTQPGAVDPRQRRERHHLKGRNVKPEWVTRPERIITVTAEEHALIHAGWLIVEGADASKPLFFHWASHVKASQKPFLIKARKRSA